MKTLRQKLKYRLMMSEREFREKTLVTFYLRPNEVPVKMFSPIDLTKFDSDGNQYRDRKRKNLITGEITNYDLKLCKISQAASIRRTKILLNMILDMNIFDWFCTLTFDKSKIDRNDDAAVLKCYEKFVHDISTRFPSVRFVTVPERHKARHGEEQGARHFHMVIGGITPAQLGFVNSGTVLCSWFGYPVKQSTYDRTKGNHELTLTDGLSVYNITSFAYGYTTATRIANREACNWYVKKYIDKNLGNSTDIFHKRFYCSRNLELPKTVKEVFDGNIELIDLHNFQDVRMHDNIIFAEQVKFGNYNTVQSWIDNYRKNMLKRGLRPVTDFETLAEINKVFPVDEPTQIQFTKEIIKNENC